MESSDLTSNNEQDEQDEQDEQFADPAMEALFQLLSGYLNLIHVSNVVFFSGTGTTQSRHRKSVETASDDHG